MPHLLSLNLFFIVKQAAHDAESSPFGSFIDLDLDPLTILKQHKFTLCKENSN